MLFSIFLLNNLQKNLIINGQYSLPIQPILSQNPNQISNTEGVAYPHPKSKTLIRNDKENWIKSTLIYRLFFTPNEGVLEIKLDDKRDILIQSQFKTQIKIDNATGIIKTTLIPPIFLKITPPLKSDGLTTLVSFI